MKVKNIVIEQSIGSLDELLTMPIPAILAMELARAAIKIKEQSKAIGLVRQSLMTKHGLTVGIENGTPAIVSKEKCKEKELIEKIEAYAIEFNEVLEQDSEDLSIVKIAIPTEIDGKPLSIKSKILMDLEPFVEVK
uniref:Uncharacterized protein n=1 Tax=viral metagenome TaxID=1070528 RepID=A0A6M3JL33_9ZZZZ